MNNLLEGEVLDPRIQECDRLRAENRRLQRELSDATVEAERAREDANRALSMLRKQLSPLYRALQAVFGELDAAGVTDSAPSANAPPASPAGTDPRVAAVWESWRQRLGPQCAKAIDALLLHTEMDTTRLAIAMGTNRRNIPNIIYKLNQAGLINKNNGKFSLKQL